MKTWSNLAKVVYKRTYSRNDNGISENWEDTIDRVLKGNKVPTEQELNQLKYLMMNRKALPAGRGLWFSGAPAHEKIGGAALNNCWFTTAENIENYVMVQDLSMLGGGVGFSVEHKFVSKLPKVKKGVQIVHKASKDADFIVPDSRDGWNQLTRRILESYFHNGKSFTFSTVCLRGYGEPILGFGGTSSGPKPLIDFVDKVSNILSQREGRHIRPIDASDILCCIGELVVSGNVRRSALIVLGDAWDKEYLKAKRWDLSVLPSYRAMANFSVVVDDVEDLHPLFWKTYEQGEPFGIFNRKNAQMYGRMGEKKKDTAEGTNPSLRAGTKVWTKEFGIVPIENLENKEFTVKNLNNQFSKAKCWLSGTNEQLIEINLEGGITYHATKQHEWPIIQNDGSIKKYRSDSLEKGMQLPRFKEQNVISYRNLGSYKEGKIIGYFYGDGWITDRKDNNKRQYGVCIPKKVPRKMEYLNLFKELFNGEGSNHKSGTIEFNSSSVATNEFFKRFGVDKKEKGLPNKIWTDCSNDFINGFISGFFDSDGHIGIKKDKRTSIKSKHKILIKDFQELLGFKGIYLNLTETHYTEYNNSIKNYKKEGISYNLRRKWEIATSGKPVKILSIKETLLKEKVWDISVTDVTHCFQLSGCVTGNCAEAMLENGEPCNLQELFLPNLKDKAEFIEAAKLMHRYGKRVTLEKYHNPINDEVVKRNRRVGTGITGCLQSNLFNPKTLDNVFKAIQEENISYSKELKIPESIRTTVIKPSGTLSLLGDVSPGIHPAYSKNYIRRVRFAANDKLLIALKNAGHPMEPVLNFDGSLNNGIMVVDFFCETPDGTPCSDAGYDTWKQLDDVLMAQKYWADQSISVTVYYKKEELSKIKEWLTDNLKNLKTISFLCHNEHGFKQAPLEATTKEIYEKMKEKIQDINIEDINSGDGIDNLDCESGACPVK